MHALYRHSPAHRALPVIPQSPLVRATAGCAQETRKKHHLWCVCARQCTGHFAPITIWWSQPLNAFGFILPFCRWENHGSEGIGSTAELPNWHAGKGYLPWIIHPLRTSGAGMEPGISGALRQSSLRRTQPLPCAPPGYPRVPWPWDRCQWAQIQRQTLPLWHSQLCRAGTGLSWWPQEPAERKCLGLAEV